MPNEDVLKTIAGCHLALFPTKRDSYGYFTLEAQACGVPVISSDYGAQLEINNDECGWIVATSNVHEHEDEILTSNLVTKIEEAFNEDLRFEKGLKSFLRIAQNHDYSNFNLHDLIQKG